MPVPIAPAPTTPTRIELPAAALTTIPGDEGPRSATLEARLSLLEKGPHTLGVIRGATRFALQLLLVVELRFEIDAERAVEGALDETKAARRLGREIGRRGPRGFHEARGLDDAIDHPPGKRLLGGDLLGEHRERGCALETDDARQDECAAAVGNDADLRERLDEGGVAGREHDVAGKGEVRPRAGGDAVDGTDDGLLERANRANDRIVPLPHEVAEVGE